MKSFCLQTKIISGTGAVQELKKLGAKKLMVVSDPFFAKNGMAQTIAGYAEAEEIQIFSQVIPDPTVALVAEGTSVLKAFRPDTVVALGGGSAMDCAKAMVYFSGLHPKFVAIPTTSGSGSEVTDFAILTHEGIKHPLVDPILFPQVAILDDGLLGQLPKSLIADGGFDVLAHALEAFVAKNASPITDALAKDAFCTAYGSLPASYAGHQEVRLRLHTASTMAGMAFTQAGLGMCHALSHVLGGMYHIPHGRLNAILLPAVISCNAHKAGAKYACLARAAGLGGSADVVALRNLKNGLIRLRKELSLPASLAQAGISPYQLRQDMKTIVHGALQDACCETNPMEVEDFMLYRVLEEVTGSV